MKKFITFVKRSAAVATAKKNRRILFAGSAIIAMILALIILTWISNRQFFEEKDDDLKQAFQYAQDGKIEDSIRILESRLDRDKNDKQVAKQLATYYFQAKNYPQFEKIANDAKLDDAQIYTIRAFIARSAGEEDKAIDCYRTAIKLQPNSTNNYIVLASYYQVLDQIDKAMATVKDGLNVSPKSSDLNLLAANYSIILGDIVAAKDYARKMLDADKYNKRALEIIGMK